MKFLFGWNYEGHPEREILNLFNHFTSINLIKKTKIMKTLENKVAVIIGGNSGIGLAVAKLYSQNGAKVAITGRNRGKMEEALAAIGNEAIGLISDIVELDDILKSYVEITKKLGKIDVLVVNASIAPSHTLVDFAEKMFDDIININLKGTFFSVQMALPYLNDGASIVLTGAAAIYKGFEKFSVYAASKAAIRSLARSFSTELISRNIRVNVVSPGVTDTPILTTGGLDQDQLENFKAYMTEVVPTRRIASAEEIAGSYLFLASEASKYMVGSEIIIDGGVTTL